MGRKDVLFLTISGRRGASSRYRVYDCLPYLEVAGIRAAVLPPWQGGRGISALLDRGREERDILEAVSGSEVVFIQKRLFPAGFVRRLKAAGKPLVFDFDDSIFTSPSGDWSCLTRRRVAGRLGAVIKASEIVVTGNEYLGDYARSRGAKRVEVLPTAIELSRYGLKEHRPGPPVLGWIGSSVNHRYLDMLGDTLRVLTGKVRGLRLLVVSDRDYRMDGVEVMNRRWSEDTEASDLTEMDVGLMPLSDDVWTRGKCALKALQYMASGVPAVCSPVGANIEVVQDGVDGYLPSTENEWVERIDTLCCSHEKRADMGAAGRRKVEELFSLEKTAGRLAVLLESL